MSFCKFCKQTEVEVNLHSFLPFALECRLSVSDPVIFIPGKGVPYFLEAGQDAELAWKLRKRQIFYPNLEIKHDPSII
jgi:hypothetical protein